MGFVHPRLFNLIAVLLGCGWNVFLSQMCFSSDLAVPSSLCHSVASPEYFESWMSEQPWMSQWLQNARADAQWEQNLFQAFLDAGQIRVKIQGAERLPKTISRKLVIVSNHQTGILDGIVIGAWAKSLNLNPAVIATPRISRLGFWPQDVIVSRDPSRGKALQQITRLVDQNRTVILFPAERVTRHESAEWKRGAFYAALRSGADILMVQVLTELPAELYLQQDQNHGFYQRLSAIPHIRQMDLSVLGYLSHESFKELDSTRLSERVRAFYQWNVR